MAPKRSQPSPHQLQPRRLMPWLVKERDLRRHLGRALIACGKGRVIFVLHVFKNTKTLFALARPKDHRALLLAAGIDLAKGRFRKVSLEKLPR